MNWKKIVMVTILTLHGLGSNVFGYEKMEDQQLTKFKASVEKRASLGNYIYKVDNLNNDLNNLFSQYANALLNIQKPLENIIEQIKHLDPHAATHFQNQFNLIREVKEDQNISALLIDFSNLLTDLQNVQKVIKEVPAQKFTEEKDHPIHYNLKNAVQHNNITQASRYLKEGADPNIQIGELATLTWAVKNKNIDMVRLLLEYGANPNSQMGHNGALYWAAASKNLNIIRLLFEKGAQPDPAALERAVLYDCAKDVANLLIEKGTPVPEIIQRIMKEKLKW